MEVAPGHMNSTELGFNSNDQSLFEITDHFLRTEPVTSDPPYFSLHMLEHLPVMANLLAAHEAHHKRQDVPMVQPMNSYELTIGSGACFESAVDVDDS